MGKDGPGLPLNTTFAHFLGNIKIMVSDDLSRSQYLGGGRGNNGEGRGKWKGGFGIII